MADDRALQKVLELRKKQEDDALAKWAESERQLKIFADQLQKLSSFRDLYIAEMQNSTSSTLDMQKYLAYQTQAISLSGGVAAAAEAPLQSATLGKYGFTAGVGANAHCPAAAALLPLLIGYANCE